MVVFSVVQHWSMKWTVHFDVINWINSTVSLVCIFLPGLMFVLNMLLTPNAERTS